MKISVGDKVRFLNEVGGGTVSRIEKDKLVYVLDEDGFEVPVLPTEIVIIEKQVTDQAVRSTADSEKQADENYEFKESDEEGDPKLVLAFIKDESLTGNVKLYLINDSNFFSFYTIGRKDKDVLSNTYNGVIEPNTKVMLDNIAINYIDGVEYRCQLLLFRKQVSYTPYKPVEESFKLAGAKLLKNNTYQVNDYLNEKAVLIHLIKGTFEKKLEELSTKDINKVIEQKEPVQKAKRPIRKDEKDILEVDLHIDELLDDTRGLSNKDMLEYQMKKFHEVMHENKNNKNRKIVFIHGKGNGVLKSEIIKSLKRKYTWHTYQDASFKEYGFGATMVTI